MADTAIDLFPSPDAGQQSVVDPTVTARRDNSQIHGRVEHAPVKLRHRDHPALRKYKSRTILECDLPPDVAMALYDKYPDNIRNLRRRNLRQYAAAMKEGRWIDNGETFKIDRDGRPIDAQHRLLACAESGVTLKNQIFVCGLDPAAYATIDIGAPRTANDMLSLAGYRNGVVLAAIAAHVWRFERGYRSDSEAPDPQQLFAVIEEHPDLVKASRVAMSAVKILRPSVMGFCWYSFRQIDEMLADEFAYVIRTGLGAGEGDPFHVLRERLIGDATTASRSRLVSPELIFLAYQAWNCRRKRKRITASELRLRSRTAQGVVNESFPELV